MKSQSRCQLFGFTLTEVVVAGVIFLIFCIPIVGLLSTSRYTAKRLSKRLGAIMLAQGIIDEVRHNSQVYGSTMPRLTSKQPEGFKVRKTFRSFEEAENILVFTVKVSWKEFKKKRELELSTLVSSKPDFHEFRR